MKILCSTLNQSKEDWLKVRKIGIGGSEAATVAGLNPWASPLNVYIDKLSDDIEDIDNERMRIGRDLEDYVAQRFQDETGLKVRRMNQMLQHEEHDFMLANLDRVIVGEKAFLECKTTGSYGKKEWEDGIPMHYQIQCMHYLAVTGFDHCYIACLIGNEKFIWHRIDRDEETINMLIDIERDFWNNNILKQVPPDADGSDQYDNILKQKYPDSNGNKIEIELSYAEKIKRRLELKELIDSMEKEVNQIDQEIKNEIQENETAVCGDYLISWKAQTRNSIDTTRLKKELPDIADKYMKSSVSRVFKIK